MFFIFYKHTLPSNSSLVIEIDALTVALLSKPSSLQDTKYGQYTFKAENWNKLLLFCAVSDTYLISHLF